MLIRSDYPVKAFRDTTASALTVHKGIIYDLSISFRFDNKVCTDPFFDAEFDDIFEGVTKWKRGQQVSYREWLIESGFPLSLYKENGCNLSKLIQDERTWNTKYQGKNQSHNFFGDMCKPIQLKDGSYKSYMEYLLERLKREDMRAYPHFYFAIAPTAWIWEELMRNKNQIKTSKASAVCGTNFYVRWDKIYNKPRFGWIFKHAIWTHLYEDIFCLALIGSAIAKEIGIDGRFDANVFFVSFALDDRKRAKAFCNKDTYRRVIYG